MATVPVSDGVVPTPAPDVTVQEPTPAAGDGPGTNPTQQADAVTLVSGASRPRAWLSLAAGTLWGRGASIMSALWERVSARGILVALAVLVAAFILLPRRSPTEIPVSQAWNDGIAKLGIKPLYPPQEDFQVGDVWLAPKLLADSRVPLLSVAVRIGHINLLDDIRVAQTDKLNFDETKKKSDAEYRDQSDHSEPASTAPGVGLSLVAFPAITLDNGGGRSAGLPLLDFAFNVGSSERVSDRIEINSVQSYAAPQLEALFKLQDFCTKGEKRGLCKDEFARLLLSYSDNVVTSKDCGGSYVMPLQVILVTRVFLTREIERVGNWGDARIAAAALAEHPTGTTPLPALPTPPGSPPPTGITPPATPDSGGISWTSGRNLSVQLSKQVFQRPLVFGYRGLTFSIPEETRSWLDRTSTCLASYLPWRS